MFQHNFGKKFAVGGLLFCMYAYGFAADSISFEVGTGDRTQMARVGAQWNWKKEWWKSNGTHIGGYWDLTLAQWRANKFQNVPGRTQNITDIGITPVFRFEKDSRKGLYMEAGIGAHYLSKHYDNDGGQLSTKFEFGDHIGAGYVFNNNVDLGIKIQHFSNGGIKKPNSGVNFAVIGLKYQF